MKHFDEKVFIADVSVIPFQVCDIFDDPNDSYWLFNELYTDILNKHAPLKTTRRHPKHAPFMNSELRKTMYARNMARNKYRNLGNAHWENYRRLRNKVVALRNRSIKFYRGMGVNFILF